MTASAFVEHCREGARRFVQTAIVIDDEAVLSTAPEEPDPPIRRAAPRSGSVLEVAENSRRPESDRVAVEGAGQQDMPRAVVNSGAMTEQHGSEARGTPEAETAVPSGRTPPEHDVAADEVVSSNALNAKELTDAFLKQAVICGLYKPDPGEKMVELSRNAALHADVIVVDWYLEGRSSQKAKEIICDVLREDLKENGRLRLITIYTSQPGCAALASELFEELERDTHLQGRLNLSGDRLSLMSSDTRICFFNKPNMRGGSPEDIVPEKELPERLIKEFAIITEGVLSTFAVQSIAAVRRAAHHIVAVFRKELDGTYVAHRCALPYPEDAKEFATELIAAELYNVISMEETADKFLSAEVLESWIDHIAAACHIFTDHRKAEASSDTVKEFIRGGENVVDTSNNRQHAHGDPSKKVSKAQAINSCSLVEIFYKDPEESWQKSREFARSSTFKREAAVVSRFPITWNPILSLGSVLKSELPTQGDA